jgi:hypothetical protein
MGASLPDESLTRSPFLQNLTRLLIVSFPKIETESQHPELEPLVSRLTSRPKGKRRRALVDHDDGRWQEGIGRGAEYLRRILAVSEKAKLLQRGDHPCGIFCRIVHQHVKIFGVARLPVFHNREAADDQVLHLKFVYEL